MRTFFRNSWVVPACLLVSCATQGADEPFIGPYVQGIGHDSAVVLWESDAATVGEVEVGESDALDRTVKESQSRAIHRVCVTGLRAGTRYSYRVKWDGKTSEKFFFRTLPPEGTRRFRLAAYGDSRSNPAVHTEIVRRMMTFEPDIVIHTGDIVTDGTKKEMWKPQFFDPLRPLATRVPVIPCIGNHEKDSTLYYDYFDRPSKQAWFSWRWANVHFMVLDSQKDFGAGSEQYKWLERELEGPDADWRIVFFHYPMFSCHPTRDVNGNRWAWQDLFDRHGVDLVITGHDHYYHRTHRIGRSWDPKSDGVYHITTAGGGAPLYPVENKIYTDRAESAHHFMIFDFDGKKVTGQAITPDGNIIDTFSIDRTVREATPFVSYEMVLWEKDLREAVEKIEPEEVSAAAGRIERRIKLPTFFKDPNRFEYRWTGGSSFWAADLCGGVVDSKDKAPFEAVLWGEGPARAMYPLPRLEITPVSDPPAGRDFLNQTIVLSPLRIAANHSVTAPMLASKIQVDGKVDEPIWEKASVASGFTRDIGRYLSDREIFYVAQDAGGLVLGAKLRSLVDKPLEKGTKDRDTRHLYRTDEAVTIVLTPPTLAPATFLLSGNSRGTKFDSLGGIPQWDPQWEFATAEMPGGWQAEARIPWIALGLQGPPEKPWRVNFFRWDTTDKLLSEWAPTFTQYGTNRKFDGTLSLRN